MYQFSKYAEFKLYIRAVLKDIRAVFGDNRAFIFVL